MDILIDTLMPTNDGRQPSPAIYSVLRRINAAQWDALGPHNEQNQNRLYFPRPHQSGEVVWGSYSNRISA